MRKIVVASCIVLCLIPSASVFGQAGKGRKIIAMLIPNPKAPSTAEKYDSPTTEAAYNTITSYLINHNVTVIDKYYVDQALEELKKKKDLDIDAASIEYGKKNTADLAILFYVTDKSGSFTDKHFECTLKAINVRTGQLKAVVSKEGEDREDREIAVKKASMAAIEEALGGIVGDPTGREGELYTVTFIGELNTKTHDALCSRSRYFPKNFSRSLNKFFAKDSKAAPCGRSLAEAARQRGVSLPRHRLKRRPADTALFPASAGPRDFCFARRFPKDTRNTGC